MGIRITVPGAAFTDYIDIVRYPVEDQLSSLFFLGGTAAASKINQAAGGVDASTPGANVSYQPNHAVFTGSHTDAANYIQTADLDNASADMALITVAQMPVLVSGNNQRTLFGMFQGAAGLSILANQAFAVAAGPTSKTVNFGGGPAPDAAFVFRATSYNSGSGIMTAYRGSEGELLSTSIAVGARLQSTLAARIGGATSAGTYVGEARIAAVSKHTKSLDANELALIYDYMRLRYAKLGVTVS